ncbi:hypothetical protein [Bradyrhizobium japonicum]|uniref:hypothetical protein n=1 Tax=Bradyrhizobium japonicum TaxID=375 RepID=UPI000674FA52|nr:hypothetical protein [Bradyrhizobium japonicum]
MSDNSQVRGPEHFTSAKTTGAIPVRHPAIRDVLIQCSLNPAIRFIDYVESAVVGADEVDLDAIVVRGEGGSVLLDVIPARPLRDLEEEGLALIALGELNLPTQRLTSEDLMREPRYSNSKLVWLYNRHHVPLDLRMQIMTVLAGHPSMHLRKLLEEIQETRSRGSRAVMALACADVIELDLETQPLGPTTTVKSRGVLPVRVEPLIPFPRKI